MKPGYELPLPANQVYQPCFPSREYKVWYGTRAKPGEGWKFHVSAWPWNAQRIAGLVLPVLIARNVWHKVFTPLSLMRTKLVGEAQGKFIAIYSISTQDTYDIAQALVGLLQGEDGPTVGNNPEGEQPVQNCRVLYSRYGGYKDETISAPKVPLVAGRPGKLHPETSMKDNRQIWKPSWIAPWGAAPPFDIPYPVHHGHHPSHKPASMDKATK